jgi:hypothetical protein
MSEALQIIIGAVALITVYILTQLIIGYRISRAARKVIHDLQQREAYDPITAVELPYAKTKLFRVGLRDFRPPAVQALVQVKILSQTHAGKYYLKRPVQDVLKQPAGPP